MISSRVVRESSLRGDVELSPKGDGRVSHTDVGLWRMVIAGLPQGTAGTREGCKVPWAALRDFYANVEVNCSLSPHDNPLFLPTL